ncbi:hypothetical protein AX16_000939 [Volvariella volvacea WC 439]|nr:hypothetical protein AX16_000939 [Volvariella volvacea WC 439]
MSAQFNETAILSYLDLPKDYNPSPAKKPVEFLSVHLTQLPPHLLPQFSAITTPRQRTIIPRIRNRRLKWTTKAPAQLSYVGARNTWPELWQGNDRPRPGREQADEEKTWGEREFLRGSNQHVGKLGTLLGDYEEEREAERARVLRRERASEEFIPEEDSDSEDDDEYENQTPEVGDPVEDRATFERRIKERFIYGMLLDIDYDAVDWDDTLDNEDDRETEDRWFNDDDDD